MRDTEQYTAPPEIDLEYVKWCDEQEQLEMGQVQKLAIGHACNDPTFVGKLEWRLRNGKH